MKISSRYSKYSNSTWGKRRSELIYRQIKCSSGYKSLKSKTLNVIDLGCGTCSISEKFIKDKFNITAVDQNEGMLLLADKRINLIANDALNFLKNTKDKFDIIICNNVIEYIEEKKVFLNLLKKVANKNTVLSFVVINLNYEIIKKIRNNKWSEGLSLFKNKIYTSRNFNCSFELKNIDEWKLLLNKSGWDVIGWSGVGLLDIDLYKNSYDNIDEEMELLNKSPYRDYAVLTHFLCKMI